MTKKNSREIKIPLLCNFCNKLSDIPGSKIKVKWISPTRSKELWKCLNCQKTVKAGVTSYFGTLEDYRKAYDRFYSSSSANLADRKGENKRSAIRKITDVKNVKEKLSVIGGVIGSIVEGGGNMEEDESKLQKAVETWKKAPKWWNKECAKNFYPENFHMDILARQYIEENKNLLGKQENQQLKKTDEKFKKLVDFESGCKNKKEWWFHSIPKYGAKGEFNKEFHFEDMRRLEKFAKSSPAGKSIQKFIKKIRRKKIAANQMINESLTESILVGVPILPLGPYLSIPLKDDIKIWKDIVHDNSLFKTQRNYESLIEYRDSIQLKIEMCKNKNLLNEFRDTYKKANLSFNFNPLKDKKLIFVERAIKNIDKKLIIKLKPTSKAVFVSDYFYSEPPKSDWPWHYGVPKDAHWTKKILEYIGNIYPASNLIQKFIKKIRREKIPDPISSK